jgi:hypothetical protein
MTHHFLGVHPMAIWRQASVYTHGTAQAVGIARDISDRVALTQRVPTEAARTLYIANTLIFVWFACFDEYLDKNHENHLEDLLSRMNCDS